METPLAQPSARRISLPATSFFTSKWKGRDISLIAAGTVVAFALFIALLYYLSRGDNSPSPNNTPPKPSTTTDGPPVDEIE